MAKIKIQTSRKVHEVDAWPYLPGLHFHQSIGDEDPDVYSITHVSSSLCILHSVHESELELVRSVLGKLLWDRPAEDIFKDNRYAKTAQEAELLTNHQRSERQEKRVSKDLGGKRQPASGSRWGYRRDVITPTFLVETKTTKSKALSIPLKDLEFIRKQAYATGRIPVYLVSLMDSSEIAVLPAQDVGDEDISAIDTKTMTLRSTAKNLKINIELVAACSSGTAVTISAGKNQFIVMGYEMFLDFAKKGVD